MTLEKKETDMDVGDGQIEIRIVGQDERDREQGGRWDNLPFPVVPADSHAITF